jgi:hypothetical protein
MTMERATPGRVPAFAPGADARGDALANAALAEGCSRVEAALWALIGQAGGVLHGADPAFRADIRRYLTDRRAGRASAATLLGMLRTARSASPSAELRAEIVHAMEPPRDDWFE